jgi:hypothetical protein
MMTIEKVSTVAGRGAPFNVRERTAWKAIVDAMGAIQKMDERGPLLYNGGALGDAIHVLQDLVKQHMCHRHWPEEFSDWWWDGQTWDQ